MSTVNKNTTEWIADAVKSLIPRGNKAINNIENGKATSVGKVAHDLFGVGEYNGTKAGNNAWYRIKQGIKDESGTETQRYWDGRKVFGGMVGTSAGFRVLSGGGLYKDSDGNTDIIGIPFI